MQWVSYFLLLPLAAILVQFYRWVKYTDQRDKWQGLMTIFLLPNELYAVFRVNLSTYMPSGLAINARTGPGKGRKENNACSFHMTLGANIVRATTIDTTLHEAAGISWHVLLPYTFFGAGLMVYSQIRLTWGQHIMSKQASNAASALPGASA